ncbi:hypothetical protein HUS23_00295 [Ectothiorhodospiraceae bacterium 2226]|nr:hypothetical protein HUS23_00295 [Ectothiorhodospiraceae bacterium 2226]
MRQLPDAIQKEYVALLSRAVESLQQEGYEDLHVDGLAGYPDPAPLTVRVLNAPIEPDLTAQRAEQAPLVGFVEVSTDLSIEDTGRRWQWIQAHWLPEHGGSLAVFVHPEDEQRAREIARRWHLDEDVVRPLSS